MKKRIIFSIFFVLGLSTTAFGQWVQVGFKDTEIVGLGVSPSRMLFTGTRSGVFVSLNKGNTWSVLGTHDVILNFRGDGLGFLTGGRMFRTTDSGIVWSLQQGNDLVSTAPAIAFAPNGNIFASTNADATTSLFISTNNGDNWTALSGLQTNSHIRSITINKNGDIFAGGQDGMFRSTDDGNSWKKIDSGLTETNIVSVAVNSKGQLFACALDLGVFRSTNNGDSWTWTMSDTIWSYTTFTFNTLTLDSSDHIFVGHNGGFIPKYEGGVAYSTDDGDSWNEKDEGLGVNSIEAIAIDKAGYIYMPDHKREASIGVLYRNSEWNP
jgi:photosystem II stability/assembly factor-like uncharacterized protein